MGSRIMHYCISTLLIKELQINEDREFLLGGIAPDIYESKSDLKERSHFMKRDSNGLIYVDYPFFKEKYLIQNRSPFNLGFYFHLITDDIWLKEIYYKNIKWLPREIKAEAKKKYYRDFRRLNGKIIDYFSLELLPLKERSVDIKEIDHTLLPKLIDELNADFSMSDSVKGEALEILNFREVIQTLEGTVTTCLANSRSIHYQEGNCLK